MAKEEPNSPPKEDGSPKEQEKHREGYWDGETDPKTGLPIDPKTEYVAFGSRGREIRLPYEMRDPCGFRVAEIHDLVWTFKMADLLGEKRISTTDARRALKRVGEECNDAEWLTTINAVDPHARGILDFQHFLKLAAHFHRPMLTEEELTNAFKIFDRDKSGTIDAVELRDVLLKLGFEITPMEAYNMLAEADDSGDGEVSYGEFVEKILKAR
jgi:calmodulin